jgi:putative transposon-encoded protein
MKIEIDDVEEVIDKKVDSYSTSTRIIIPKKYANRRVKVLILKEEVEEEDELQENEEELDTEATTKRPSKAKKVRVKASRGGKTR